MTLSIATIVVLTSPVIFAALLISRYRIRALLRERKRLFIDIALLRDNISRYAERIQDAGRKEMGHLRTIAEQRFEVQEGLKVIESLTDMVNSLGKKLDEADEFIRILQKRNPDIFRIVQKILTTGLTTKK